MQQRALDDSMTIKTASKCANVSFIDLLESFHASSSFARHVGGRRGDHVSQHTDVSSSEVNAGGVESNEQPPKVVSLAVGVCTARCAAVSGSRWGGCSLTVGESGSVP
eukprot:scaffold93699_cov24-Tisochrysis_lutea.AAC.1